MTILLALCLWPFCHHSEIRTVTLNSKGSGIIPMHRAHKQDSCAFTNTMAHGFELRLNGKQFVHVFGQPGEIVIVTCR
jgi:hypothetical protein